MELDRQAIERKDFPIGRRGYDPDAVDAAPVTLGRFNPWMGASLGAARPFLLCKEFVLHPIQLDRALDAGADAVLLIVRILEHGELPSLVREGPFPSRPCSFITRFSLSRSTMLNLDESMLFSENSVSI